MVTETAVRVIDPEFAFYGPLGFDIGMLIGNYLMAFHAMSAHLPDRGARVRYQDWILATLRDTWTTFEAEFTRLWRSERGGILYPRALYEDQGQEAASEAALSEVMAEIFADLAGFAGIEMHRRILGLAHVAELESIRDPDIRAPIEERCLRLGRDLVLRRKVLSGIDEVIAMARAREGGEAK